MTFKCPDPDCMCFFFTQSDLDKHTAKFGQLHAQALKKVHRIADNRYASMEFNGADRAVSDIEKIIKEHYGLGVAKR
jgi:hypothetical protein